MSKFAVSADGTRIAYEVHGAGHPPLVMVHGWSCDRGYWDAQVQPLSREFRIVTVDLAGHGESGAARQEWTIAAFGADVAAVVNDLALRGAILIGHSMGGDVILEAARLLAGRIDGLVWVDTYSQLLDFSTEEEVRERMTPFRADFAEATRAFVRKMFAAAADRSLVERVAADMSSAPVEVALGAMEAAWNFGHNVPAILRELGLPLVAINSYDSSTDIESMRRLGVDVALMHRVGHFPMMEDPRGFNERLTNAVKTMSRF